MSDRLNLAPLRDINLVDLLTGRFHLELKKSGKNWQCKCPFHTEDTASFSVYIGRDGDWRWHCFGTCDLDGDTVDFVQRAEHIEFIAAVLWLAEYAHIDPARLNYTKESAAAEKKQASVSDVLTRAAQFFAAQLHAEVGSQAHLYALARGFTADHIKAVGWGMSRSDDALVKAITRDAPDLLPVARECGLIRADGRDFTANANGAEASPDGWLVYPHYVGRRVVYFNTRALTPGVKDKSRNLPGPRKIYRADTDLPGLVLRDDGLVLVEGSMDAESVRSWHWPVWAMCGAPIDEADNPDLIAALRKRAERQTIYAAMSNDAPGRKFADKIAAVLGPLTRIVLWPKAKDEDKKADANDLLKRGADESKVTALLDESETYLDTQIWAVSNLRDVRKKADGLERLAALVAQLSETERRVYVGKVADGDIDISRREFERMVKDRLPCGSESLIEIIGGRLSFLGDALINCAPRVESELIIDDGFNPPTIEYHILGKLPDGRELPAIDIEAGEFDGMRWIGKSWGARAYMLVGSGKTHLLKRAILETSLPTMTTQRVHTFTGFYTVGGARAFLTAGGALSDHGIDETARVDLPNNLALYRLSKAPTGPDLIEAVLASLAFIDVAPQVISVPLWAAMYAAPLTGIKSLNAVLWPYGPTQSKKSSISHLALSHFGLGFVQGRDYKAPMDWTSTAADMEAKLFTTKDVPTIIDDYAPQFTGAADARDISKRAHYIIRSVGNRSSRGRRNADMTARMQFIPRGLVVATAEQPLSGQSIVGRTITVPFELKSVDLDRLTREQAHHHLYSAAMAGYVAWLCADWDRLTAEAIEYARRKIEEMQGTFENQDRLTDYYGVLMMGVHTALKFAQAVGAIDNADELEGGYSIDLITLLEGQSRRIADQSPVVKLFTALEDMITSGQVCILPRNFKNTLGEESPSEAPHGCTLVGWQIPEDGQIWLLTNQALIAAKAYWSGLDERLDAMVDALRREMWQLGYIAERDDRQMEVVKYINRTTKRCRVLVIDADKVRDTIGVDLLNRDSRKTLFEK
jgi:hypothetical protein